MKNHQLKVDKNVIVLHPKHGAVTACLALCLVSCCHSPLKNIFKTFIDTSDWWDFIIGVSTVNHLTKHTDQWSVTMACKFVPEVQGLKICQKAGCVQNIIKFVNKKCDVCYYQTVKNVFYCNGSYRRMELWLGFKARLVAGIKRSIHVKYLCTTPPAFQTKRCIHWYIKHLKPSMSHLRHVRFFLSDSPTLCNLDRNINILFTGISASIYCFFVTQPPMSPMGGWDQLNSHLGSWHKNSRH